MIPVVFVLGCGDSDNSENTPFTGPIEFTPLIATATAPGSDVEAEVPSGVLMEVFADGLSRKVIVGMGGIYEGDEALLPECSASNYDRVLVVCEGESGEEVVVDSSDLRLWIGYSPFAKVPTKASIPDNTQEF